MPNPLKDDALLLLTRGYDAGAEIWKRARPGARAAPMRVLGKDAMFVRGAGSDPAAVVPSSGCRIALELG